MTRWSAAATLFVALTTVGCTSDPEAPPPPPPTPPLPTLPPAASLGMDAQFFAQTLAADDSAGDHYWYSANRVGSARGVTEPVLIVPETLLRAAQGRTPVLTGGAWHWRFTVDIVGSPYTTDVTGRLQGEESVWEVRVTAPNHGIVNGLWYDGRARVDGTAGVWRVYHVQQDPEKVLGSITWSHPAPDVWTIGLAEHGLLRWPDSTRATYTVNGTGRSLASTTFVRTTSDTSRFDVVWDAVQRDGSLVTAVYNGGEKACWGTRLQNVPCPP